MDVIYKSKGEILNVFTYLGSLKRGRTEVGGHLAPECLWILDRLYVFREGVKTLRASESKGALTCSERALNHDVHFHISVTADSVSLC